MGAGDLGDRCLDLRDEALVRLPEVHRDRERLPLDSDAGQVPRALHELTLRCVQVGQELPASLLGRPIRPNEVEAVAPRVRDPLDADHPPNVREIAAAHDRDRGERGEPLDGGTGRWRERGILRALHDRRERAVVVEEDDGPPCGQRLPDLGDALEGRWEVPDPSCLGRRTRGGEFDLR